MVKNSCQRIFVKNVNLWKMYSFISCIDQFVVQYAEIDKIVNNCKINIDNWNIMVV